MGLKTKPQEVRIPNRNYKDLIYPDDLDPSIYPGEPEDGYDVELGKDEKILRDLDERLEYDWHMQHGSPSEQHLFREARALIADILLHPRPSIRINQVDYTYRQVRDQLLRVTGDHVAYVAESLGKTSTDIRSIRSYLLTALYNSPDTIDTYYGQQYLHDAYG